MAARERTLSREERRGPETHPHALVDVSADDKIAAGHPRQPQTQVRERGGGGEEGRNGGREAGRTSGKEQGRQKERSRDEERARERERERERERS
eukprot:1433348-Rhodomonas_salina.1